MKSIVVKIGGSTLGAHDTTLLDLVTLQRNGLEVVVVHGGGALITQWLEIHQIPSRFVRGLRVTDQKSLQVVTAVLAGLVNKDLVATLQRLGGRAVGLSGVDGGLVCGRVQDPELGLVGETDGLDLSVIAALRSNGFMPVVAPLGLNGSSILNFNADTLAGDLAAAMRAERLVFLTDVPGVRGVDGQVRNELTPGEARALIEQGAASGGMIPKLEASLRAHSLGTESWIVDGREEHALLKALGESPTGTRIS